MKLRSIALAAVSALSLNAQAALTTYAPWDAAYAGNGLAGVLFDVHTANGATIALGAHAYRNGVNLPNDGQNTFSAQAGVFGSGPNPNYANWSFDTAYDLGTCVTCSVWLGIDEDPSAGVSMLEFEITNLPLLPNPESWNMKFDFLNDYFGYDFNPFAPSSTAFSLQLRVPDPQNPERFIVLTRSDITVNVPEPGSLALLGLGLAGLAAMRRRKA